MDWRINWRLGTFICAAVVLFTARIAAKNWPSSPPAVFFRWLDSSDLLTFGFYLLVAIAVLAGRFAWEQHLHRKSERLIAAERARD